MPRIFLTGASGYIGGEVLYRMQNSSLASAKTSCLIRDPKKAEQIRQAYPDVEIVVGDLDNTKLITEEAEKADVVLHIAHSKHVPSTEAIAAGLRSSSRKASKPGTWIQISGATVYAAEEIAEGRLGEASDLTYGDMSDVSSILALIRNNPVRVVEQTVLAQDPAVVQTALIIGPLIYGVGHGPRLTRSMQGPELARTVLKLGHGIRLLKGENAWSNVHVIDVGSLIVSLAEAALANRNVGWNEEGIYNPENGSMKFGELDALISQEAVRQGLIEDAELTEIDAKKAEELSPHMSILWGTNAVIKGERAESLGWKPEGHSLADEIPDLVRREAEAIKH